MDTIAVYKKKSTIIFKNLMVLNDRQSIPWNEIEVTHPPAAVVRKVDRDCG